MIAEHPLALSFLLPGNVYLLANDRVATIIAPAEQIPEATQVAEPLIAYEPAIKFNYTGGYQQKFLILVHYPGHDVMEPVHLTALESTIKRKDLNLEDIAILNVSKYPDATFGILTDFFKPVKMLLLGKNTLITDLAAPVINQLTQFGSSTVLYSFSFDEMIGNKDNTKAFWEQMKLL